MYAVGQVNSFVGAFHDAVMLYALALNETLAAGLNATDGAALTRRMWNRTFEGLWKRILSELIVIYLNSKPKAIILINISYAN